MTVFPAMGGTVRRILSSKPAWATETLSQKEKRKDKANDT
jgi:hypothetical protein